MLHSVVGVGVGVLRLLCCVIVLRDDLGVREAGNRRTLDSATNSVQLHANAGNYISNPLWS